MFNWMFEVRERNADPFDFLTVIDNDNKLTYKIDTDDPSKAG